MLSVWKLGHGQEAYYLEAVAKGVEDYYVGVRRRGAGSAEAARHWVSPASSRPTTFTPCCPAVIRRLGHGSASLTGYRASI